MNVKEFFKKIGKSMMSIFHAVEQVIPHEYLTLGVQLVAEAAIKFATNPERREYVVNQLVSRLHIPESIARIIVEAAVHKLKDESEAPGPPLL